MAHIAKKRNTYRVLWGNLQERDCLEDLSVYERIILKMDLTKTGCDDVEWTGLALDRGKWQAFVNTIMNLRVPRNVENFLTM